jgi:hypothetical protein
MSQYPQFPSPYQAPPYAIHTPAYDPTSPLLAPARRAGLLMIILGSALAVYSLCNGVSALVLPADKLLEANPLARSDANVVSPQTLKTVGVVFSAVMLLVGMAMIVLGVLTRQNSSPAIVTGIILSSILALLAGVFVLVMLVTGLTAPLMFGLACVLAIPLALLILNLFWLVQALRAVPQLRAMHAQYQAQFWQYQQSQQAYAQQPWYGGAPPPPPPAQQQQQTGGRPDDVR